MRFVYLIASIWITLCATEVLFAKQSSGHEHAKHPHKTLKKHTSEHKAEHKTEHKTVANHKIVKSTPAVVRSTPSVISGTNQLSDELNHIINSAKTETLDIAVVVKSMQGEDLLYERNSNQSLTPASTLKVMTAEAALLFLGSEYRFSTQLLTDAKAIKNGILQGNLYIVLSGDPTLTYYSLIDLVLSLKSQQIRAVAGNVYIDNTAYDQVIHGPGWDAKDVKSCYGAPISASIIDRNCISFGITSAKGAGRAPQLIMSPRYFYPPVRNAVITSNHPHNCTVHLAQADGTIALDGCIPAGRSWGISYVVTDMPDYSKALFKSLFNRLGINVYGTIGFGTAPETLSLLSSHASKPLSLLINDMLKRSDNVIAGALFKKIGQLYTRQPGSWENGGYAVTQILARYAGVDTTGLRILDGSGISPSNVTTPAQLMQVLDFAYHHYPTSYEFVSALPIAGVDGTLKHRMGNIARKVRAKTGTISGVTSLAGYTVSADREPLAFVIMINGEHTKGYKEIEDRIVTVLTRFKRGT